MSLGFTAVYCARCFSKKPGSCAIWFISFKMLARAVTCSTAKTESREDRRARPFELVVGRGGRAELGELIVHDLHDLGRVLPLLEGGLNFEGARELTGSW